MNFFSNYKSAPMTRMALLQFVWLLIMLVLSAGARASGQDGSPLLIGQLPGSDRAKLTIVHPKSGAKIEAPLLTYLVLASQEQS